MLVNIKNNKLALKDNKKSNSSISKKEKESRDHFSKLINY